MRENVVRHEEVCRSVRVPKARSSLASEELHERWDAGRFRGRCDVACRLDAEHRHTPLLEVLKQVAVVAGDLENVARRAKAEPFRHLLDVITGMAQPALRIGREVGVIAEEGLGIDRCRQLDEEAPVAGEHPKRIEGLLTLDFRLGRIGVRERGAAEVGE